MQVVICPKASLSSFASSNWKFPEAGFHLLDNNEIGNLILKEANDAETTGNIELAHSIAIIGHAVRIYLDAKNPNLPYKPFFVAIDSRGADLADFTDSHLDIFEHFLTSVNHPIVVSRLSDILWLRRHKIEFANKAIDSFIAEIDEALSKDCTELSRLQDEARRIIQLWLQTGSKPEIRRRIAGLFEKGLFLEQPEPENFLREIVLHLVSEHEIFENPSEWVSNSLAFAEISVSQNDYRKAREYLECAMNFARQIKDEKLRRELLVKQTDLYESEAEEGKKSGRPASQVQHLYFAAIRANQETNKIVGGRQPAIQSLHKRLNEIQPEVLSTLAPIEFPLELDEPLRSIRERLKRCDTHHGLALISLLTTPPSKAKLVLEAEDLLKQSPLYTLFGGVGFDSRGRVTSRTPGSSPSDEERQKAAVLAAVYRHWKLWSMSNGILIDQGRFDLLSRYENIDDVFDKFLECNPFVPKDRIEFFKRGLVAGLRGDWMVSMHILVPQVENSIRNFMETVGVLVTKVDEDLIQEEHDLNRLLYRPEMASVFTEDQIFQLRGLFTEKLGYNFRNSLAHGLAGPEYFSGGRNYLGAFIWAFTIYLCISTRELFFNRLTHRTEKGADEGAGVS